MIGESSEGLKLTGARLEGKRLSLDADVFSPEEGSIEVRTPWAIANVQGGSAAPLSDGWTRLTFSGAEVNGMPHYAHRTMSVELQTP